MTSPVYQMMNTADCEDIIIIAIMDMMFKHLTNKNISNRSRKDRLEKIHGLLMNYESRYVGAIPEAMGDKADKFNKAVNRAITALKKP